MRRMSVTQATHRGTLLEWVKDNGLLTITILGLLLYALFAIPTTIFYANLGTSPAEVGITYTTLLSSSAPGTLMVLGIAAAFLYYVLLLFTIHTATASAKGVSGAKEPDPRKKDWELDNDDFESRVARLKGYYCNYPEIGDSLKRTWGEHEDKLRCRRQLQIMKKLAHEKMEKLAPEKSSELKSIQRQIAPYHSRATRRAFMERLKRRPTMIIGLYLGLLAVISGYAYFEAQGVKAGYSYGGSFGPFGFRVEKVMVCPAAKTDSQMYAWLSGRPVYLLGEMHKMRYSMRLPQEIPYVCQLGT